MPKKKRSLRGELVGAVIISLLCATAAAGFFTAIADALLGVYFKSPDYSVFYWSRNIILLLCFGVFIAVLLVLVNKKIRYINHIAEDVGLLEGGNLDCPIKISGDDELSRLAEGLDGMRASLKQQIEQEKDARRANSELVTSLSHDLRTPLTTQLGYLEIIRDGHWETREQCQDYINKCIANCVKLKEMSDRMFEYFLIGDRSNDEAQTPLKDYDALELLPQLFAEKGILLEEKGYTFNITMPTERFGLRLNMEYTFRSMNNIYSNLEKYADMAKPVEINVSLREGRCFLDFFNALKQDGEKPESTGIGLQSVAQMTKRQNGQLDYGKRDGGFFISLSFPAI